MIMTETTTIDKIIPRADVIKRAARVGAEIRNVRLSGNLPEQPQRGADVGPVGHG